MSLARLENACLAYGDLPLLDKVTLQVERGDRICITGRNGVGKSSLIKVLAQQITLDSGRVWLTTGCKVGYLNQSLSIYDNQTVYQVVASGLGEIYQLRQQYDTLTQLNHSMENMQELERVSQQLDELDGWQMENRVNKVLSRLQLAPNQLIDELSGGWRRRVNLARALVAEPDLLLLDEPTNHMDLVAIEWLEQHLLGYQGALVFITHDRRFLSALANQIVELDRGNLYSFPGTYEQFLSYRQDQLAQHARQDALFDKKLAQEEVWIRQGIKARRTRNEGRVRALQAMRLERSQRLEKMANAKMKLDQGINSGTLVCQLEQVCHTYSDTTLGHSTDSSDSPPIIKPLDFTLLKGDRVGLIGANGVGKSTLLKIMLGELSPSKGKVKLGTKVQVAYFDQLQSQLQLNATVLDNLAEGRQSIDINGKSKHVMSYLSDFLFTPQRVLSKVSSLSGGEKNRLLLAKLFSKPANLLVLDEPTNDLDIATLELLEELLMEYSGTVLLVSHDRDFVDKVVTSCLIFDGLGKVEEQVGSYSDWYRKGGRIVPKVEVPKVEVPKADVSHTNHQPDQAQLTGHQTSIAQNKEQKKLSYKLQRELDQLPSQIETMEAQQVVLQDKVAVPDFYKQDQQQVQATLTQLAQLQEDIETSTERWLTLTAMQEGEPIDEL